jgi:hypothetical protein
VKRTQRALAYVSVPFFLVACTLTYYGQLHRKQGGDTYGTVYTAVALVEQQTIWLDDYVPYIQERVGEYTYMLTETSGHVVTATPTASSALVLPAVAVFSALGVDSEDFDAWLEAAMLTAALAAAGSVAFLFAALRRLTTHAIAAAATATYAWGTLTWGISGQALWQHAGATLALAAFLYALVSRRLVLAGLAAGAMVAFRLTTGVLAFFVLPLVGRTRDEWGRFLIGVLPYALALAAFNTVAFGSPLEQGYGSGHVRAQLSIDAGNVLRGVGGLLVSPGKGLLVYSPVLLFSVYGAIAGWRTPLYRWSALAAAAYVVVSANSSQWHGGEAFGARRVVDVLPLLALLLVPALERIRGSRWAWLFGATLAWSVLVQLLGASVWETAGWYDTHDITRESVWWNIGDNEIVAMLRDDPLWWRLPAMAALLGFALAAGAAATVAVRGLRRPVGA